MTKLIIMKEDILTLEISVEGYYTVLLRDGEVWYSKKIRGDENGIHGRFFQTKSSIMSHKFQKGDPVFHKGEGYENIAGHYNVTEVGRDGTIYRVTDSNGDFTDADEEELEHVKYALFVRVEYGWPIIVPVYYERLYNHYLTSDMYRLICEDTASSCIEEQTNILTKLESASH